MSGSEDGHVGREVERQLAVMRSGALQLYGEEELRERLAGALQSGRPLRVKLGMDPSSPDLHLGHSIVLQKLKLFQDLGHLPIFLVGDFTARIGDPSGKKKTRPALGEDEVRANAETYVDQAALVLDVTRAEVRFNSEWMSQLSPADFVVLCSHYTVARLLERDDFAKRYAAGEPIAVHEFLYPFVQAYDSVALEADVELGGSDQTFNLLMAREIQRSYGQSPQAVLTHPLLVGIDGHEKMSKSLGNSIGLTDPPEDAYGKIMSVSDALMLEYLERLSFGAWGDLEEEVAAVRAGKGDPMRLKQSLAERIVGRLHGSEAATAAGDHFRRVVQRKELPAEIPEIEIALAGRDHVGLLELIEQAGWSRSLSEARRLVAQGGVQLDGARVEDPALYLGPGSYLLRVGKRRFARLMIGK